VHQIYKCLLCVTTPMWAERRVLIWNLSSGWRKTKTEIERIKMIERDSRPRERIGQAREASGKNLEKRTTSAMAENRWFFVKIESHHRRGYQATLNWTTIIISTPILFGHGFSFDGEFYFSRSGNCRFDDADQAEPALAEKNERIVALATCICIFLNFSHVKGKPG